jgi:hypothetical protein
LLSDTLKDENIYISVQAHFLPETVKVQFLTIITILQSEREGKVTMKRNYSKHIGVVKITVSSHSCSLHHSTKLCLYSNQLMLQNLTCYHCTEDLVNRISELRLQRNSKNTSAISFFIKICSLVSNAFLPSQASTYHGNQEVDNQL